MVVDNIKSTSESTVLDKFEDGSFTVIYDFMTRNLHLSGAELIIYAKIYTFSRQKKYFNGSINFLVAITNTSRATVIRALKSLVSKKLIVKINSQSQTNIYIADLNYLAVILNDIELEKDSNDKKISDIVIEINGDYFKQTDKESKSDDKSQNDTIPISESDTRINSDENLEFSKFALKNKYEVPSIEEIKSYCDKEKIDVDAEQFYTRYQKTNWKIRGTPVFSWKKLLLGWLRNKDKYKSVNPVAEIYYEPLALEERKDLLEKWHPASSSDYYTEEEKDLMFQEYLETGVA